jgi:hypothetical protein
MLLHKKAADAFVQSIMSQFMRTDEPRPFRCKPVMNDDESPAQLTVVQSFGRGAQIAVTDMDAQGFRNNEGAVGAVFSDEFVNDIVHTLTCYIFRIVTMIKRIKMGLKIFLMFLVG